MVKKYKIILIVVLLLSISIIGKANSMSDEFPLLSKVIYLDPGHGGIDSGAKYKDIYEKKYKS